MNYSYIKHWIILLSTTYLLIISCSSQQEKIPLDCVLFDLNATATREIFFPDSLLSIMLPITFGTTIIRGDTTSSIIALDTTKIRADRKLSSLTLSVIHDTILTIEDYYELKIDDYSKTINRKIVDHGVYYMNQRPTYWLIIQERTSSILCGYFAHDRQLYSFLINVPIVKNTKDEVCSLLKFMETIQSIPLRPRVPKKNKK